MRSTSPTLMGSDGAEEDSGQKSPGNWLDLSCEAYSEMCLDQSKDEKDSILHRRTCSLG